MADEPSLDDYDPTTSTFKPGKVTKVAPIGVPIGYRAPDKGQRRESQEIQDIASSIFPGEQGVGGGIGPRYFEDDLDRIAGMSPEYLTQLQYRFKEAGLLKTFRKGLWTDQEDNAMSTIFAFANRQGLLWEDALGMFAEMAGEVGAEGTGRAFTARLSNPDDLKKAFTQALYDAQGGRFIDDTQMQNMIDAYQQREYASQRAAFDNAATVEEAPTAQTFAAEEAKKMDPTGVQAAKFADFAQVFEDVING